MSENALNLDFESKGSITVATIVNAKLLDATNVVSFRAMALDHVQAHEEINLLINFEHIQYMSSAGLTELLRINEVLKPRNRVVHLCGLNKDIYNVFRITNLDSIFVIHESDSTEDAAAEFNASVGPDVSSAPEAVQPGTGN